jgi:hypothetical protein
MKLSTLLQFSDLAVAKQLGLAYGNVKVKYSTSARLREYVSEFKNLSNSHGKVLFCQPCTSRNSIAEQQRSKVTQRFSESKHIAVVVGLQDRAHLCIFCYTLFFSTFQTCHCYIYAKHLCPQTCHFLK